MEKNLIRDNRFDNRVLKLGLKKGVKVEVTILNKDRSKRTETQSTLVGHLALTPTRGERLYIREAEEPISTSMENAYKCNGQIYIETELALYCIKVLKRSVEFEMQQEKIPALI